MKDIRVKFYPYKPSAKTYSFKCDYDDIKFGDAIISSDYSNPMKVVLVKESTDSCRGLKLIKIDKLNGVDFNKENDPYNIGNLYNVNDYSFLQATINTNDNSSDIDIDKEVMPKQTIKKENKMKSMSKFIKGFERMFMPVERINLGITFYGDVCVNRFNQDDEESECVTIQNGELVSFPSEFILPFPVYTINKPVNTIKVGDTIYKNNIPCLVLNINKDFSFKLQQYDGEIIFSKSPKNIITGQSTIPVVFNMFANGQQDNQSPNNMMNMLPLMMMSEKEDNGFMKMMPMMMMMQGQNGQNPMQMIMMMQMFKGDCENNDDMMKMMMMSSIMGGQNPMMGLFGQSN